MGSLAALLPFRNHLILEPRYWRVPSLCHQAFTAVSLCRFSEPLASTVGNPILRYRVIISVTNSYRAQNNFRIARDPGVSGVDSHKATCHNRSTLDDCVGDLALVQTHLREGRLLAKNQGHIASSVLQQLLARNSCLGANLQTLHQVNERTASHLGRGCASQARPPSSPARNVSRKYQRMW